ncbi:unnamed protein product [Arabidopsis arenosa]|uniref:Phytocyanin domain-containing protein n=1 Tax=Arabidopsis arenosa TaxID=38785 RepID=A0A8S1ZSP5_ARAAE|nr:unnamed protein product [Arabidopsis arenosa]
MGLVMRFDLYLMFVMLMGLGFTISNGYKFYVGGKDGWVPTPILPKIILIGLTETGFKSTTLFVSLLPLLFLYNYLYNVSILMPYNFAFLQDFKYGKGKDSVLEVREQEYNTCNTTTPPPLTSLPDGDSLFLLSHSGSFFFISGNSQNCLKGQKLAVKVLSTVHHSHSPRHTSPSSSPSPSLSPVHQDLSSPVPSPGVEPSSVSNAHAPAPGPTSARNSAGDGGSCDYDKFYVLRGLYIVASH